MAGNRNARKRSVTASNLCALVIAGTFLSACTVVSVADDKSARERHNENFNAAHYVSEIWTAKVAPAFGQGATEAAVLLPALQADFAAGAARFGRQAAIDAPWTFAMRGEGVVAGIDNASRAGTVTVNVQTSAGIIPVEVQSGPVVSGSALRDSQAYISFNDFNNQIAYAQVSTELNRRALANVAAAVGATRIGQKVIFAGAFTVGSAQDPVRMMPFSFRAAP